MAESYRPQCSCRGGQLSVHVCSCDDFISVAKSCLILPVILSLPGISVSAFLHMLLLSYQLNSMLTKHLQRLEHRNTHLHSIQIDLLAALRTCCTSSLLQYASPLQQPLLRYLKSPLVTRAPTLNHSRKTPLLDFSLERASVQARKLVPSRLIRSPIWMAAAYALARA